MFRRDRYLRPKKYFEFYRTSIVYLHKLVVLGDIEINILINRHALQLLAIISEINQLLDLRLAEVGSQMSLVLGENLRLGLFSPQSMSQRSLNNDLIEHGAVVQSYGQRVGDGAHVLIVVVLGELWVLDALDLLAQGLDEWGGGSLAAIRVIGSFETSVNKHDGSHVLDAMVAVGEVVHGLELFVDDADAGFVCAAGDLLDICCGFAHICELLMNGLGGLDGGLGVELGFKN